jgi:phage terminase small subunit
MAGSYRSGGRNKIVGHIRDARGCQRALDPDRELRFPSEPPPTPEDVASDPKALTHWDALMARLRVAGLLQTGHIALYRVYAHAHADYDRLREQFAAAGYQTMLVGARKTLVSMPLERQIDRSRKFLLQLEGELGLTPLSAGRTAYQRAAQEARDDAFDVFLTKRR